MRNDFQRDVVDAWQPRAKTVLELIDLAQFIYAKRPLSVDAAAAEHLNPDARAMLRQFTDWSAA